MVFSSIFFLFCFLPVILALHFVIPHKFRNLYLLLVSLFFYSWGEGIYVLLMLLVVLVNYLLGLLFTKVTAKNRKALLFAGVALNLIPLLYFKYSLFLGENINQFFDHFSISIFTIEKSLHLPLGISFFTFQALSYLIDTYKRVTAPQKNLINLGLYIALFPQLIAGPIVRYHNIAAQIEKRTICLDSFSYGVERFIKGLAKKVLLANPLGQMADIIFATPTDTLPTTIVWLGAISYTLQIYYDFSGYSDMAIGLGKMFGFTFPENFNLPYISKSIQEFWRRWHISLASWFRDYLYIPLGGNRGTKGRTVFNLFTVFFLCGLWHGASWNFIFWGLFHGFFLALERGKFGAIMTQLPTLFRHTYVLLVVLIGWVFFRAESFEQGSRLVAILFGASDMGDIPPRVLMKLDLLFVTTLLCAFFFSLPVVSIFQKHIDRISIGTPFFSNIAAGIKVVLLGIVLIIAISALSTGVYNPFIYFRF